MKITGVILAIIGLIGIVICLIPMVQTNSLNESVEKPKTEETRKLSDTAVPLAISGMVMIGGVVMAIYGGKGYIVSNDPQVRN